LPKGDKTRVLLLLTLVALFLFGVTRLFMLRFEKGDVYPAYSSLRADPLGTKVFFESLANLKSLSAERNYRPLSRVAPEGGATFFFLGAKTYDRNFYTQDSLLAFDRLALNGGRLVISFFPSTHRSNKRPLVKRSGIGGRGEKKGAGKEKGPDSGASEKARASMEDRWGFAFGYDATSHSADLTFESGTTQKGLPTTLSWHSTLYFRDLKKQWQVIYARKGHPVVIERKMGRGAIVLFSDSYWFSNEALSKERHPHLLAWVMGNPRRAIFDESHFGIRESPGVARLARRYGLTWLFFGILLLAGLFVWKNSVPFVPPPAHDIMPAQKGLMSRKDHVEGLTSLLRRCIPSQSILSVCLEEWEKTASYQKEGLTDRLEAAKQVVRGKGSGPLKGTDLVGQYRTICEILSKGKGS
jgi:hypothetical protein